MVHRSESELKFDDIIFEKKNKYYGAYYIRNIYNRHLRISILISTSFFAFALVSPKIVNYLKGEEIKSEEIFLITEVVLAEPPPIDPKTTPPPPVPAIEQPPKIASTKFLPPKIMENEKVILEEETPKQEDLIKSNPGDITQKGDNINLNEVIISGNGNAEVGDPNEIFMQVSEKPGFIGDYKKFLRKNLRFPNKALSNDIQGKVYLSFIIEKDGSITDIKIIKKLGYGCDEEAIRVVKLTAGNWTVAKNNGVSVRYKNTLDIEFKLINQD